MKSVTKAIAFERTKKQLTKLANQSLSDSKTADTLLKDNGIPNGEDQARLKNIYWEELTLQSAMRLKSKVDNMINAASPSMTRLDFCEKFKSQIAYEQNYWRTTNNKDVTDPTTKNRDVAWSSILLGLSNYLFDSKETKDYASVITDNIENLNINDSAIPNSLPPINCNAAKSVGTSGQDIYKGLLINNSAKPLQ